MERLRCYERDFIKKSHGKETANDGNITSVISTEFGRKGFHDEKEYNGLPLQARNFAI